MTGTPAGTPGGWSPERRSSSARIRPRIHTSSSTGTYRRSLAAAAAAAAWHASRPPWWFPAPCLASRPIWHATTAHAIRCISPWIPTRRTSTRLAHAATAPPGRTTVCRHAAANAACVWGEWQAAHQCSKGLGCAVLCCAVLCTSRAVVFWCWGRVEQPLIFDHVCCMAYYLARLAPPAAAAACS